MTSLDSAITVTPGVPTSDIIPTLNDFVSSKAYGIDKHSAIQVISEGQPLRLHKDNADQEHTTYHHKEFAMFIRFSVFALIGVLASVAAHATDCPTFFVNGQEPKFTDSTRIDTSDRALCFEAYSVYYSGKTLTPLWSAEHLTAGQLEKAKSVPRKNSFHEEKRLPEGHRATLADYSKSGYDRGHMSPSADFPAGNAQYESFSLANMVPQAPKLNQHRWKDIEDGLRKYVIAGHEVYVITGPIFEGDRKTMKHVTVPSSVYKLVIVPGDHQVAAVVCINTDDQTCAAESVSLLEKRTGLTFLQDTYDLDSTHDLEGFIQAP